MLLDEILNLDNAELEEYINTHNYNDIKDIIHECYTAYNNEYVKIAQHIKLKEMADELNVQLVYRLEDQKMVDDTIELYNMYKAKYNTINTLLSNKKSKCNHKWVLTGTSGYMRENDVYTCELCGAQEIK